MGNTAQGGARGEPSDPAELRQIDALNRIESRARSRAEGPAEGRGESSSDGATGPPGDRTAPPAPEDPDRVDSIGRPGPGEPGADAARHPSRWRDALLLETGHALAEADSLAEALKEITRLYSPDLALDGVVVFGVTDKFLNILGQYGYRRTEAERVFRMPVTSRFPATEVVRSGRPVYLHSADEYRAQYPETWPLAARHGRHSWAFLPLVVSGRITGVCLLAFSAPMAFTPDERGLLVLVARLVAQALERTRTSTAELALSRGLRRSMGSAEPAVPGISVATRYVPTGGGLVVGGDWYDIINLPGGRLALVIGDVQGHDVHAAGLMAQLRTAVHAYAAEGHGPDAVLARTSRFLTALDEDRYATCLYIEAEPDTGMLHIARAGHPHPVLRLPDGTCMIKHVNGGLPLGLMPEEHDYPVTDLELRPGEVMMLCTDGLIETGGHDMFTGWVRVRDAMEPGPGADLEGMADRLIQAVHHPMTRYEGDDRAEDRVQAGAGEAGEAGRRDGLGGRRVHLAPRNEDDIALLLLRRDTDVPRPLVPERTLVLTIGQDEGEGLSEARAEVVALLHDWSQPDQVDVAVLLASELVGNVLVHTDQTAVLRATITGERGLRTLMVEVSDRGDELPHQRAPGELASSGRGLMMLDILAEQWSVRPESEGKTVWFSLAEDAPPPEPPAP
ncbi:ATP-binding SpoIIE family protein phosphatase [Actinacidiphila acidipaludis]|uniref:SpoIIE family protein phosphatase n=1 Tax=Actinacidiphila acidipaludis TaxID=2873382 RepID=A0ABS7Q7P1_9ACTN|nr:SpoIIE family protein phosphatase [Streptomyces acidipaludis]MBY8878958.1 SpoIIE family protein phosphatase [Streptomyces acidipaludis]